MATSDNVTIPHGSYDISSISVVDGAAASVTVNVKSGTMNFTGGQGQQVEVRDNGHHLAVPVTMKVADGNSTLAFSCKALSFIGASNTTLWEAMTFTGNGSARTTTGAGTFKQFKLVVVLDTSRATGGVLQTLTWNYCTVDDEGIAVDFPDGDVGEMAFSVTSMEEYPTIT